MKKYMFYSKKDSLKEAIGYTLASNKESATVVFATLKQLCLTKFNSIFEVKNINNHE